MGQDVRVVPLAQVGDDEADEIGDGANAVDIPLGDGDGEPLLCGPRAPLRGGGAHPMILSMYGATIAQACCRPVDEV